MGAPQDRFAFVFPAMGYTVGEVAADLARYQASSRPTRSP